MSDAKSIFGQALEIKVSSDREAYLNHACGSDATLRAEVEKLLVAADNVGDFMGKPAVDLVDTVTLPAISERPGTVIGPYKLMEPIGEGGFGLVFLAIQERPVRRQVALKIIKPGMDTHDVIARFEAERQALALMDHQNIAKVFNAGATESGRPYFVMELVRGVPITTYCDVHLLTPRERLELFVPVCQAIQHAHQKGIIHRDIKPSNVMVTSHDGRPVVKVIDFGVAKALSQKLTDRTVYTRFAQMLGTPLYMSPEQAEMSGLDVDTRSDIFSLGVLLYELLTGDTPFDRGRLKRAAADEIRRILCEEYPPCPSTRISQSGDRLASIAAMRKTEPAKLFRLIRGDLDWIVMKCLEKDRTRRYETANGLAQDIQRFLSDEAVVARPPSGSYRLRKFIRRNKLAFTAASAVIASLVFGLGLSTWLFFQERQALERAITAEREMSAARANEVRLRRRAEAGERKAIAEAAKSEQVATLIKDMFKAVGPSVALGRDTSMLRDILDSAVKQLETRLETQPEVEAELRLVLGKVFRDLGEYPEAEAMHRRALELNRNAFGNEHPKVAESLDHLAQVLVSQRHLAEAERLHREALEMRRRILGSQSESVAESLDHLGLALHLQMKNSQAEPLYREAVAIRRTLPNSDAKLATSLANLAVLLRVRGRLSESESLHREALAIRRSVFGSDHPEVALSVNGLANLLRDQGELEAAEALHREALAIRKKVYGEEHPYVAQSLEHLAIGLFWQGKVAEAERTTARSILMRWRLSGEVIAADPHSFADQARLRRAKAKRYLDWCRVAIAQHKLDAAVNLAQCALETWPEDASPSHKDAQTLNSLAWLLATLPDREVQNPDAAVRLAEQAVAIAPNDGAIWNTLGVSQYRAGQWKSAIDSLQESVELRGGGDSYDWLFLSMARAQLGHIDQARKWYNKAAKTIDADPRSNEKLQRFRAEAKALLGEQQSQSEVLAEAASEAAASSLKTE